MAKKSVEYRNIKRKKMAAQQYELRKELRKKTLDFSLSDEERDAARKKLSKLPRNGASCRVRNRCQVTGRPRGVYRKFMLSRIVLREFAHQGFVPGMTKSSW